MPNLCEIKVRLASGREQGITFQRSLNDARRELAHHYLLLSFRDLNETAYLLGYKDANFFRAVHP